MKQQYKNRQERIRLALLVALALPLATKAAGIDPFGTDKTLRRDTGNLVDPLGRDCPMPAGTLTFAAAANLALCKNPQTREAWAQAHEQAAALGVAEGAWLPTLTATGDKNRVSGRYADVNGNITDTAQRVTDAAAVLDWTLYDFGARTGKIESARKLLDAAASTTSRTVQQTVATVAQDYYGAVAADASLAAARTSETIAKRSLDISQALQKGGVGALGDVLQAQTAYEQAVLTRLQAEATAKSAQGTLSVELGINADQTLRLAADPVPDQVPELSARMADLMAEAARQRPDLAAAQSQVDAARANVQVALATGLPTISIGAQHSYTSTTSVPTVNYNQIGISVSVPLFSGFGTAYGVRQAKAAVQVSEENLEQIRLGVTYDVWSGYYNLDSANKQVVASRELLQTAIQNEQVSIGRYQAGVGSMVDVLTAQTALAQARQTLITSEQDWEVARANLALALGRLSSAQPLVDAAAALP